MEATKYLLKISLTNLRSHCRQSAGHFSASIPILIGIPKQRESKRRLPGAPSVPLRANICTIHIRRKKALASPTGADWSVDKRYNSRSDLPRRFEKRSG
jgi:hypothetical protein